MRAWQMVLLTGCAMGCIPQSDHAADRDNTRRAEIMQAYPCVTIPGVSISSFLPDTAPEACSVVRVALSAIASGTGMASGITPSDSADVIHARVSQFTFVDLSGGPDERYWSISLTLTASRYVHVTVDQDTGEVKVGWDHPPGSI